MPRNDRDWGMQPYNNRRHGNNPYGSSYGNGPYGNDPYGDDDYGYESHGVAPYGNGPYDDGELVPFLYETNYSIKPNVPVPDNILEDMLGKIERGDEVMHVFEGPVYDPEVHRRPVRSGTAFLVVYVPRDADADTMNATAMEYLSRELEQPGSGGQHHWYVYEGEGRGGGRGGGHGGGRGEGRRRLR